MDFLRRLLSRWFPVSEPFRLFPKRERQPGECPKCGRESTFYPWGDTAVECPVHGLFIGDFAQFVADLPEQKDPPSMPWILGIPDSPDD